jgi:succinate dehydrogenase/fumarate reductase cytochrome b subunit
MKNSSIYSIAGTAIGLFFIILGLVLWANNGFPKNELIPYKNTFGQNPIHLAYFGIFTSVCFTVHGILRHGWFNTKST